MTPISKLMLTALTVAALTAACGDSAPSSDAERAPRETTSPTTTGVPTPASVVDGETTVPTDDGRLDDQDEDPATADNQFVGLGIDEATALAESESRPWRMGRDGDEFFALTSDYVVGRVTFEVDDGTVTAARIEIDNSISDPGPPTTIVGDSSADLISGAIVRIITEDNTFGGGFPFDLVYVATLLGSTFEELDPKAIDHAVAALDGRVKIEVIADAEGKITDLFEAEGTGDPDLVAVVSVDDVRINDDTAEVDMSLWCGSLCGIGLTYSAQLVDGVWQITGITGPVAVS